MSAIRHLWSHHRIVFLVFLAATVVTLFFLVRLMLFTLYWSDPAHRNLAPEPWMTPGYVAHSWGLDPKDIAGALGVPPGTGPTLDDIARIRGVPVAEILREVETLLPENEGQ